MSGFSVKKRFHQLESLRQNIKFVTILVTKMYRRNTFDIIIL